MTFGIEAIISAELGLPSNRIENYDEENNVERLMFEINLVEEKREQALIRTAMRNQVVAGYYDKKFRSRVFKKCDLVLKKILVQEPGLCSFGPKWDGSFRFTEVIRPAGRDSSQALVERRPLQVLPPIVLILLKAMYKSIQSDKEFFRSILSIFVTFRKKKINAACSGKPNTPEVPGPRKRSGAPCNGIPIRVRLGLYFKEKTQSNHRRHPSRTIGHSLPREIQHTRGPWTTEKK